MNDALTETQHREVGQIAELRVRRYFDHYLKDVWPKQQAEIERHTRKCVEAHDADKEAHGGTERKVTRFTWLLIGAAISGGAGGAGLARVLMTLGA